MPSRRVPLDAMDELDIPGQRPDLAAVCKGLYIHTDVDAHASITEEMQTLAL